MRMGNGKKRLLHPEEDEILSQTLTMWCFFEHHFNSPFTVSFSQFETEISEKNVIQLLAQVGLHKKRDLFSLLLNMNHKVKKNFSQKKLMVFCYSSLV